MDMRTRILPKMLNSEVQEYLKREECFGMSPAQFIDDPNWARFIPEMSDSAKNRSLPAHEDCTSIDAEKACAHLKAGGTLGAMPGYEERPGQIDMLLPQLHFCRCWLLQFLLA